MCGKEPGDTIGNHIICRQCNQATIARMNKLAQANRQREAANRSAEKEAKLVARKQHKASSERRKKLKEYVEGSSDSSSV